MLESVHIVSCDVCAENEESISSVDGTVSDLRQSLSEDGWVRRTVYSPHFGKRVTFDICDNCRSIKNPGYFWDR